MGGTKERIIESYLKLGAEIGYDNVTLSDISGSLNIRKASLFSHFKSFDELKEQSLNHALSSLKNTFVKTRIPFDSNKDKILNVTINSLLEDLLCEPTVYLLYMSEQKKTYTQKLKKISETISFMLYSRLEVAFDFMGLSEKADIYAMILTEALRGCISDNLGQDTLMDKISELIKSFMSVL